MMAESTEAASEVCVFVDANYLRAVPRDQRADWERLLWLSRQRKIKIYISYIAREEWRTGRRDQMIAARARALTALRDLRVAGQHDLLKDEGISPPPSEDLFPSIDDIEAASLNGVSKFIEGNRIFVVEPTLQHQMRAWNKYFAWEAPFHIGQHHDRDQRTIRDGRKTHIPDAWIAETVLDRHADGHTVFFLGSDGNLNSAFRGTNIVSCRNVQDILSAIDIEVEPSPTVPITAIDEETLVAAHDPPPTLLPTQIDPPDNDCGEELVPILETPPWTPFGGDAAEPQENTSSPIEADSDARATRPNTSTQEAETLDAVTSALESYDTKERWLQIRVLGYVYWTAPMGKKQLVDLIAPKGYEAEHIRNTAERLVFAGFLDDTGNSYTPRDKDLCRAAGQLVLDEIDEALDD